MTTYSKLSVSDQADVQKELQEADSETKRLVLNDTYCTDCWRIYYNCVCSHIED